MLVAATDVRSQNTMMDHLVLSGAIWLQSIQVQY